MNFKHKFCALWCLMKDNGDVMLPLMDYQGLRPAFKLQCAVQGPVRQWNMIQEVWLCLMLISRQNASQLFLPLSDRISEIRESYHYHVLSCRMCHQTFLCPGRKLHQFYLGKYHNLARLSPPSWWSRCRLVRNMDCKTNTQWKYAV